MRKLILLLVMAMSVMPAFALDNDNSGMVDVGDVQTLADNWLTVDDPLNVADLNGDEDINVLDFELLASQWLDSVADVVISDHLSQVVVSNYINYCNPDIATDTEYHFELIVETGSEVAKLYFTSPAGNIYAIPAASEEVTVVGDGTITTRRTLEGSGGTYQWFYDASFPTDAGLADYGDGTFTITALFADGGRAATDVWFGVPDSGSFLSQPVQEPVMTSFSNGATVSSPVTFGWNTYEGEDANYLAFEAVSDVHSDILTGGPLLFYATGLGSPLAMGDGDWTVKLAFAVAYPPDENADGIEVRISKYTESDYTITVAAE